MATVQNLADPGAIIDDPMHKANRTGAATPLASVTPEYSGEIFQDTTNGKLYRAEGLTSADWVEFVRDK